MSAFEFFFSFYGLILGLSAAELLGGFARLVEHRRHVRFGALTLMLGVFVAIDIASFWNQAWVILRNAPFSYALLILGLVVAGVYYVAAALVFPRAMAPGQDMDEHFWANRRVVFLCVLGPNLVMASLMVIVAKATGEFATLGLNGVVWGGLALFVAMTLTAALARPKQVVTAALVILLVYQGVTLGRSTMSLIDHGGWSLRRNAAAS